MLKHIAEQAGQGDQAIWLLSATYGGQLHRIGDKHHIWAAHSSAVTFKRTAPRSLRKKMFLCYKTNKKLGEDLYLKRAEEEFKTSSFLKYNL